MHSPRIGPITSVLALIIICLLFPALAVSAADAPPENWIAEPSAPVSGGYGEGVVGTDEGLFLVRCLYTTSQPQLYFYTPTTGWTTLSAAGLETGTFRNGTALAWDSQDHIYALAGGRYNDTERTVFLRYTISTNSWEYLASTPYAQGAGDAITWSGFDNKVYAIVGSREHNGASSAFLSYDPETDSWTSLPFLWTNTDDGASLAWDGGEYIYALRGEFDEITPNGYFARFNLLNQTWKLLASLPDPNGVGDGGSLLSIASSELEHDDYIYALSGGSAAEAPGYGFFRYQISTNTWDEMPSLPCPIGYYVGQRLTYTNGRFYYWQGSPTTSKWVCGGGAFFSMPVTTRPTTPSVEAIPPTGTTDDDATQRVATLPDGTLVTLYDDFTWEYYNQGVSYDFDFSTLTLDTIPSFLRQGIQADVATQTIAVEMYLQGWRYVMPSPKSSQAAWGNSDGRTTWWYGYWHNIKTEQVSATQPVKKENGLYYGDDQDLRHMWRRGGSPRYPTTLEWLLSQNGGVKPLD